MLCKISKIKLNVKFSADRLIPAEKWAHQSASQDHLGPIIVEGDFRFSELLQAMLLE